MDINSPKALWVPSNQVAGDKVMKKYVNILPLPVCAVVRMPEQLCEFAKVSPAKCDVRRGAYESIRLLTFEYLIDGTYPRPERYCNQSSMDQYVAHNTRDV